MRHFIRGLPPRVPRPDVGIPHPGVSSVVRSGKEGGVLMATSVLISNKARELLEKEQERRIRAKWKRRTSLEEIASEAIFMFVGLDSALSHDNSITKQDWF